MLTDPELRYRQRYVDLTVNPEYKQIFLNAFKVINSMRDYFSERLDRLGSCPCGPCVVVVLQHTSLHYSSLNLWICRFITHSQRSYIKTTDHASGFDSV